MNEQARIENLREEVNDVLRIEIMRYLKLGQNIYCDEVRNMCINNILSIDKYMMKSKENTRNYLRNIYYNKAKLCEKIYEAEIRLEEKKRKRDLAIRRIELQERKEERICAQERKKQEQIKSKEEIMIKKQIEDEKKMKKDTILLVIGIVLTIIFLPVGLIVLGILDAASKSK